MGVCTEVVIDDGRTLFQNSFSMTMVPGTNGLSPAVLLSKREELTASIEDLAGEKSRSTDDYNNRRLIETMFGTTIRVKRDKKHVPPSAG